MKNKLIRLITILLSVSIFTTSFSLQISASETISGVVIQNEWEYELKDDIMTWTFLKDDSDIVMTIENGVCNVDGNIISINILSLIHISSKKIRSVKKTMALNGGFCGSFAPYGYMVDPKNKRQLLVDPETAPTVKRIFELSKQGNSVHQIARALCEDGILIPRAYRAMKNGTLDTSNGFKFPTDWVGKNVKMILENRCV